MQMVISRDEVLIYQPSVINIIHYTSLCPEITYALNEHFTLFITTVIRAPLFTLITQLEMGKYFLSS